MYTPGSHALPLSQVRERRFRRSRVGPVRTMMATRPVLDSATDMRPIAAIERFLERLFERPGARLFRPAIHPIQIQRRIERAMEHARHARDGRVAVPDHYVVRLHPSDLPPDPDASRAMAMELADAALRFAREHRYVVGERPQIELVADRHVRRGEVDATAVPTADRHGGPPGLAASGTPVAEGTARYEVRQPRIPPTVLRSVAPDGQERHYEIVTPVVTIGRANDNQLVLDDGRASRHHARLTARSGGLVFTDLDSTNGSIVNGRRVRKIALGPGDRIEVGRTVLFVESVGGSAEPV